MRIGKRILLIIVSALLIYPSSCSAGSPPGWTQTLHASLSGASKLRVRSGGICHRSVESEKTLLEVEDVEIVDSFIQGIVINDSISGVRCMCCGNPTFEFFRKGQLVASISFHHVRSLRWLGGKWSGDGMLTKESADFVINWLAKRGVKGPQKEREESLRRQKKMAESQEKWLQAMPSSLKQFWPNMRGPGGPERLERMNNALSKEYSAEDERIRALFQWYGSGEGPWSGFPSYEEVAEEVLLLYETEKLLNAIRDYILTTEQTEGAARFFAGGAFSLERHQDLSLLSAELKSRLLKHSLMSDNADKRRRAKKALQ